MDQDATWYRGRPQPRPHCARYRPSSPGKGHSSPLPFLAHVYCNQTAGWIQMPLGTEVGFGPGDIVLDGTQLRHKKGAQQPPYFSVHVYCGQTVGCIRIPLGTEVGLIPSNIVLDGDPAPLRPPRKEGTAASPTFRPTLLWNGRPSHQLLSSCISFNSVKSYFHSSFTAEERRKLQRKLYKLLKAYLFTSGKWEWL